MPARCPDRTTVSLVLIAAALAAIAGCSASAPKPESDAASHPASASQAGLSPRAAAAKPLGMSESVQRAAASHDAGQPSTSALDFATKKFDFPAPKPPAISPVVASPKTEPVVVKAQPQTRAAVETPERDPVRRPDRLAERRGTRQPFGVEPRPYTRPAVEPSYADVASLMSKNRPAETPGEPTRAAGSPPVSLVRPIPEPVSAPTDPTAAATNVNPLRRGAMTPEAHWAAPNPALAAQAIPVGPAATANPDMPNANPPASRPLHPANKHSDEKFDPLKWNGPIFVGWPKTPPRLALVITGRQEGYLEPCGCAGLDRMKGGMSRRYTLLKTLRDQGWPVLAVDVGELSKGFGLQAVQKFHISVDAYRQMGYAAIGLGGSDLQFPIGDLISVTASQGKQVSPFVCANVAMGAFDPSLLQSYRVVKVGDVRVGITGVLGAQYQKNVRNAELVMEPPEARLAEVYAKLQQEADYFILLAYATLQESTTLAQKFPRFNIVVTADGGPEPPDSAAAIKDTQALMVQVGEKGMNAIVIGLYDDPDPKKQVRYQRVPLDSRFENAAAMKMLMAMYQSQLEMMGFEGLGVRAVPHPKVDLLGKFVGSDKCESCHEESYKVWKRSAHARALTTLEQADPPRHFDPECISCHVVGWNGPGFFPYESGYQSKAKTPRLAGVGCESCHGPGEKHVAAESGGDVELQKKLQKAMTVTKAEAESHTCRTCHDLDNSPAFKFETYWPLVEHREDTAK